jgi:hypothetical protein
VHAGRAVQRHRQDRPHVNRVRRGRDGRATLTRIRQPQGLTGGEHPSGQRAAGRHTRPDEPLRGQPDRDVDAQSVLVVRVGQHHGHQVGAGDLLGALRDPPQRVDRRTLAGQHLPGDCGRRLQPLPAQPRGRVQVGVVDRHRRGRGERLDEIHVLGGELPALTLGEVEVAEDLVPDADRHAEETVHRRMTGREPDRARIVADLPQPDRVRVVDERAQQPLAFREVADDVDRVGRHPAVDELGQPAAGRDHTECRVAGTHQLAGGFDDPAQHRRQVEAADDQLVGPQQPPQPALRRDDLLRAGHQLRQELVELEPRHVGKRQRLVVVGCSGHGGLLQPAQEGA